MTTLIVGHTQLVTEQFDRAICDQMSGPIHGCEEDLWVFITPQQEVDIDSLMIFQRLPCFQEPDEREMEGAVTYCLLQVAMREFIGYLMEICEDGAIPLDRPTRLQVKEIEYQEPPHRVPEAKIGKVEKVTEKKE